MEAVSTKGNSGKRVLMVAYFFPPVMSVGTARTVGFARSLPKFGWDPTVLTVKESKDPWVKQGGEPPAGVEVLRSLELAGGRVCDLAHGATNRLYRAIAKKDFSRNYYREVLCFPDAQVFWLPLRQLAAQAKAFDVIYVSASPFSAALNAAIVKRFTKTPLVLDFRDPWTFNAYSTSTALRQKVEYPIERWVLQQCDHLVVNTPGARQLYCEKFPEIASRVSAIPNGYDALTPAVRTSAADAPFTIVHVGNFYGGRQPDVLLEALTGLQHFPIEFIQIGGEFPSAEQFKPRVKMTVHPPMPRDAALKLMSEASLLYLCQAPEPRGVPRVEVAAKTYEYLATGIPILAELPEGDNADMVRRYSAFPYVVTSRNVDDVRAAVVRAFEARDSVTPHILPEFVDEFSRETLTGKLADVFDRAATPT